MSYIKAGTSSTDAIKQVPDTSGTMEVLGSNGFGLKVKSDGRVYGDKLHNIGTVTGTTDQFIASGTYTPTITHISNMDSSSVYITQWTRVGNVVSVFGRILINITSASTATSFRITLPIASNFTTPEQCGGSLHTEAVGGMSILADTANDQALFSGSDITSTGNTDCGFSFGYTIV